MKTTLLPLALLLGPASLAAAENLETLVVTATGYPVSLSQAPAGLSVITRDEIRNSPALDIADLLRFHTGLEIGRNGGPGQATSLFIRGTESDQNLVMIDGVPINSGSVGSAALQHIDPRLIERIEIYKGPRSTLWGSGAIGGVVNIITRDGGKGTDWGGSLEGGEENSWRANARTSYGDERKRFSAALAHQRTDGFRWTRTISTASAAWPGMRASATTGAACWRFPTCGTTSTRTRATTRCTPTAPS